MAERNDTWSSGDAYEPYVGRWSRLVARQFVAWLGVPPDGRWLDVGCGTGALITVILDDAAPRAVTGIDPAAGFISYAQGHVTDPRVTFDLGDARSLPYQTAAFDAVVSGLVLNFVPEPALAVAEMARVSGTPGVVAVYVWDYAGQMQLMRYFWDAAMELDPAAQERDEGRRFAHVCNPDDLAALMRHAGLLEVATRAIDVPTRFRDFDDFWSPFLSGQAPAPSYAMSLGDDHRAALRDRIRANLPIASDGSINLMARAWAVRGER